MRLKQCTVTQIENFNRVSLMLPLWFCFLYCLPEIRIFFFILSSLEKSIARPRLIATPERGPLPACKLVFTLSKNWSRVCHMSLFFSVDAVASM